MNSLSRFIVLILLAMQIGIASRADAKSNLVQDETLYPDTYIISPNGQYQLWMQTDGNLVLYNNTNGAAEWASNTEGHYGLRAIMQSDGNLVIYNDENAPHWSSKTSNRKLTWLEVQDDGNLVLYQLKPSFATNTWTSSYTASANGATILAPGSELSSGTSLLSGNSAYSLTMQTDGNLVLYRSGDNQVLWASWTQGTGASRAVMQTDGNFVLYNLANQAIWSSRTENHPGSALYVQDDGNVVIYTPVAIWAKGQLLDAPPAYDGSNYNDPGLIWLFINVLGCMFGWC